MGLGSAVEVGVKAGWGFPCVSVERTVMGEVVQLELSLCVGDIGECVSHAHVVLYFEDFCLLMDMIGRCCFGTACSRA